MRENWKKYLLLLVPCAAFLALALGRIHTLMGQDEIGHYFKITSLLFEHGYASPSELIVFSPHGYPLILTALCKIAGNPSFETMRFAGIISWLLCMIFTSWKSRSLASAVILCCMPLVCQAAVLLDIDETVLVPASVALWYASSNCAEKNEWWHWCFAAVAMCLALWCRLTTPFIVCAAMLICHRKLRLLSAYAAGTVLFLASWFIYCRVTGVFFMGPFEYLLRSFLETSVGARASSPARIMQSSIYVLVWGMNPMLALLFGLDGVQRIRRIFRQHAIRELDSAWLCGAMIFVAYLFIGGSLFGFPKYQCPAFPFIAMCCGVRLQHEKNAKYYWKCVVLCIVATMIVVASLWGDPLLFFRSTLRCKELPSAEIFRYAYKMALVYFVPLMMAFCVARYHLGVRMSLLLTAVAFNFTYAYKQNTARYSTGYIYGERGECRRLADKIEAKGLANELLYVPAEVSHHLGGTDERSISPGVWDDFEALASDIAQNRPAVVAASSLISKRGIVQALIYDEGRLQTLLNENYTPYRDLSLFYWIRKDIP